MKNGFGIKHAEVISSALKWLNLGLGRDRDIVKHVVKHTTNTAKRGVTGWGEGLEGNDSALERSTHRS